MPRSFANPAPQTEAARQARQAFFCELCGKGYSRSNEFEAHENSYDHMHKKRLKEMKQLTKESGAATDKARRAESKESGLTIKPIKLDSGSTGGGFKKGGFKSAFGAPKDDAVDKSGRSGFKKAFGGPADEDKSKENEKPEEAPPAKLVDDETDEDDFDCEYYDPRKPTGCGPACSAKS